MEIDQAVSRNRASEMDNQIRLESLLKSRKDQEREMAMDNAFRDSYDQPTGKYDNNKLGSLLSKANPRQGYEFQQQQAQQQAEQAKAAQAQKTGDLDYQTKIVSHMRELMPSVRDQQSYDNMIAEGKRLGAKFVDNAPPEFNQDWVYDNAMKADEWVKQNTVKQPKVGFTPSGVAYDENNPQGIQLGGNYAKPEKTADPQKVDYNKPFLPDGTPNKAFQDYEKDKKDQVKLKTVPAAISTAIVSNKQSLSKLDNAIKLLEGNDVGTGDAKMLGDKDATGLKGVLPPIILNRLDPKGTDARAQVADIGSLIIHDRSGAAVTVSEAKRLTPFIPNATDDNATALKKLRRLREMAKLEDDVLANQYNEDAGYKMPNSAPNNKDPINKYIETRTLPDGRKVGKTKDGKIEVIK